MSRHLRRYQIILLGPEAALHRARVVTTIEQRVKTLGDGIWDCIDILTGANASAYDKTAPIFVVWFGSSNPGAPHELDLLKQLLAEAKLVLPVVADMNHFKALTPEPLHPINGLLLDASAGALDRVVDTILIGLQLLRRRRRLFISYTRKDSQAAAKQLFGAFAEHGFDVFLDTHSVPAASEFQLYLWHSMVDSDLVVLLDTNGVDASHWCRCEYERADALSIGVVRVLWPDRTVNSATDALQFSFPLPLHAADFVSGSSTPTKTDQLTDAAITRIAGGVEGFRARSIAARQAILITTFQREATAAALRSSVQPNCHIHLEKSGPSGAKRIAVVPTIGVPVSTNFHDAFVEYAVADTDADEQIVLYDRQGFLRSWVDHLSWLNATLPVKGIDITEVPRWLSTP